MGWKFPAGFKAVKGTVTHKVLEILAKIKLTQQEGIDEIIADEIYGIININDFDIHDICEKVYAYYIQQSIDHTWTDGDFSDCKNWVNKTLDFNNGSFSPLKMNIVSPEQQFDIPISEEWATYDYNINGKQTTGCLSLKGTIDLITEPSPGTYEIVDWKTGRRLNWATGEEKTHEKLKEDPQLRMYHLAAHYLYPQIDQILVSIFYISDGGPFTLCYTKDDIPKTLDILRKKFEHIKKVKVPKLTKSWKCSKFCAAGKNNFAGTKIKPMHEFRERQVCEKGKIMTICEQVKYEIEQKSMDNVVRLYTQEGHDIAFYQNPGSV